MALCHGLLTEAKSQVLLIVGAEQEAPPGHGHQEAGTTGDGGTQEPECCRYQLLGEWRSGVESTQEQQYLVKDFTQALGFPLSLPRLQGPIRKQGTPV